MVDGITTEFIDINRGVPQGTVLGPILFSLMVNDIQLADPRRNLLVKFADDKLLSLIVPNNNNKDFTHLALVYFDPRSLSSPLVKILVIAWSYMKEIQNSVVTL